MLHENLAYQERKWGGTTASRDDNGQMDVYKVELQVTTWEKD